MQLADGKNKLSKYVPNTVHTNVEDRDCPATQLQQNVIHLLLPEEHRTPTSLRAKPSNLHTQRCRKHSDTISQLGCKPYFFKSNAGSSWLNGIARTQCVASLGFVVTTPPFWIILGYSSFRRSADIPRQGTRKTTTSAKRVAYLLLLASGSLKSSSSGGKASAARMIGRLFAMVIDNKPEGRKPTY